MTMIDNKKILELIKKKGLDKFQDDILNDLETSTSEIIKNKLKEYSNKNRIVKNDNKKICFPAKEILSDVEIKKLPKWVREDIDNAIIIQIETGEYMKLEVAKLLELLGVELPLKVTIEIDDA